ncbi:forkhead box protein R1 [Rhynchocyon petersi]
MNAITRSLHVKGAKIDDGVDLKLGRSDFWGGLHGQVPGLLDWDWGAECFLACTDAHQPAGERNRECGEGRAAARGSAREASRRRCRRRPRGAGRGARSRHTAPRVLGPLPRVGAGARFHRKPPPPRVQTVVAVTSLRSRGSLAPAPLEGEMEVPESDKTESLTVPCSLVPSEKDEDSNCSEGTEVESLPASSSGQSPLQELFTCSLSNFSQQKLTEEEEAENQDERSSVALPTPHKRAPLQNQRLQQTNSQEGQIWSRPPLNYFHLIALALRNSPSCGLNVQQIYSFARQHFPFFRTAPEGWKNTVRHNLCFRDCFEKVPANMQAEASTRPRSCLWRLTAEGQRRFEEETHTFDSTRLQRIQQCMSQPGVRSSVRGPPRGELGSLDHTVEATPVEVSSRREM